MMTEEGRRLLWKNQLLDIVLEMNLYPRTREGVDEAQELVNTVHLVAMDRGMTPHQAAINLQIKH